MQRKVPSAIANITLNRATFTDVLIDGLTFVNFFYGNNGAGKSSIAHAIAEDDGVVWADGKTVDDFDVLVYNQDFINDNFVNYGDLKGVFIFGEEDIEAKKKIAELTNQKKQKMDARQTALDEYKKKSDGLASALTQFQDTCFSKTASIRRRLPVSLILQSWSTTPTTWRPTLRHTSRASLPIFRILSAAWILTSRSTRWTRTIGCSLW